jgi:hypothetical protein
LLASPSSNHAWIDRYLFAIRMDSRPDRDHFWTRKSSVGGGFPQGRALDLPGVEVRLENHEDYRSVTKFSGIVSIEVFEHFTRPSLSAAEKVAIHLRFFERCHDWLNRGSRLLCNITYGPRA